VLRVRSNAAHLTSFGGHSGGGTPLPIPKREVKPASADGTRRATSRERRSPPNYLLEKTRESGAFLLHPERAAAEQPGVVRARAIAESGPDHPHVRARSQDHAATVIAPGILELEPRPARPHAEDSVPAAVDLDVVVGRPGNPAPAKERGRRHDRAGGREI